MNMNHSITPVEQRDPMNHTLNTSQYNKLGPPRVRSKQSSQFGKFKTPQKERQLAPSKPIVSHTQTNYYTE